VLFRRRRDVNAVRFLGLLACAVVIACGPAGGASPAADPSPVISPAGGPPGVTGTVTAGPVCPVETVPPKPECASRPVAGAVIVATDAGGQEVGRATTAADGSYQMLVGETGTLTISGLPVAGLMRAPAPVNVTLTIPGEIERLDLQYDTGIR
jgi:hypothetical protein